MANVSVENLTEDSGRSRNKYFRIHGPKGSIIVAITYAYKHGVIEYHVDKYDVGNGWIENVRGLKEVMLDTIGWTFTHRGKWSEGLYTNEGNSAQKVTSEEDEHGKTVTIDGPTNWVLKTLKELVKKEILNQTNGIDINRIKIVRHAERVETAYRVYDLYKQGMLDFYQSVQSKRRFEDCDYILSFVGGVGSSATFVGAYEVGARTDLDKNKFIIPTGFPFDKAFPKESYYHYELKKINFLNEMIDKLVVDWGNYAVSWSQLLHKNDKEIISLNGGYLENNSDYDTEEELEYSEGREFYRSHIMRERNAAVIKKAKESFVNKHGKLFCEACEFDFTQIYGERGKDYIEGHHTKLVSQMKDGDKTKISDIAMLCSNCHRMIHRKPIVTVEELALIVKKNKDKWTIS